MQCAAGKRMLIACWRGGIYWWLEKFEQKIETLTPKENLAVKAHRFINACGQRLVLWCANLIVPLVVDKHLNLHFIRLNTMNLNRLLPFVDSCFYSDNNDPSNLQWSNRLFGCPLYCSHEHSTFDELNKKGFNLIFISYHLALPDSNKLNSSRQKCRSCHEVYCIHCHNTSWPPRKPKGKTESGTWNAFCWMLGRVISWLFIWMLCLFGGE
jgi:hypothetical protein